MNPATTLRYYARWIPNMGQRWVDLLDRVGAAVTAVKDAMQAQLGTRFGTKPGGRSDFGRSRCSESARKDWWAVKDSNLGPAD